MKKLIILLFTCLSASAQDNKTGYLFDELGNAITQQAFKEKTKTGNYSWVTYQDNDSLVARLVVREKYGNLNKIEKNEVITALKEITGKNVNEDQTIIINFAFKESVNKTHCLDYYSSVKSYRRYFKNKSEYAQFYIVQKGFNYPKDFVYEDKDDKIRKLLFFYGADCNYIIIKPNGSFYRQMSEHHQDKIPAKARADW